MGIFPDIFTGMAMLLLLAAAVGALAATPANIHNIDSSQGVNTNDDTNAILRSCWRGERYLSSLASRQSTYRLIHGSRKEATRNWGPFPFGPKRIDAMILSHAHIDLAGRLLGQQKVVMA